MPLILPGNVGSATAATGYDVANSCRFNGADSAELTLTPTAGNQKTWTFSFWTKRSTDQIAVADHVDSILEAGHATNPWFVFTFNQDVLQVAQTAGASAGWSTAAKFRDTSAWYHIVLAVDTTQSTSSITNGSTDRMRIFVNGVQQTLSGGTVPSQNADLQWSSNVGHHLFGASYGGQFYDGYVAEVFFIDGSALAPTAFGEFDSNSPTIWKPKDCKDDLTFGSEGYYLDFADSGDLGDDESGNGNDWTEVNLAATDQSIDTCTNNFTTLNPLAQTPQKGTTKEGNLEYDRAGGSDNWVTIGSTIAATAGKWYYEYKIIDGGSSAGNGSLVGFLDYNTSVFQSTDNSALTNAGEYAWYGASGNLYINGTDVAQVDSYTDGDIVMVAMDLENSKAYWGKNGTWISSGDPTSGATGTGARDIANVSSGCYAFAVAHREGGNGQANFGSPPYANSSSVADGNGYGAFEYAPPSGYLSLCTKNLGSDGG